MFDAAPDEWEPVSLADCLDDFRNGWTYDTRAVGGTLPITRIETISNGEINYERVGLAQADERIEAFRLCKNDILFSHINSVEHIAKVAMKRDDAVLYHGMNLMRLRPNSRVDPEFLFARLQSNETREYFRSSCKRAVNQASLNKGEIGGYAFHIPPLPEQKRIAEVLLSVEAAIVAANAVIEQSREARAHQLDRLLALPGDMRRISDVARLTGGYVFPLKFQGKANGTYPFAKVSDMNRPGNEIELSVAENYVDETDLSALKAKTFPVGSTIFPKVGAALLTNKRRIASRDIVVDNNVMVAIPQDIDPWFLYYAFRTVDMADYCQTGAIPSVNQGTIGQITIPVPARAVQQQFVSTMHDFERAIEMEAASLSRLQRLKAALAADLLSGRVRVPA